MRFKQRLRNRRSGTADARHYGKILIASLTLGGLALVVAVVWYYLRQKEAIEFTAAKEVTAIAEIKVKQIVNWRLERLGDGHMLEVSGMQRMASDVISGRTIGPMARGDMLNVMRYMETQFLYTGAALVDRDARIRLELNLTQSNPSRIGELGRAASRSKHVALEDLYWDANLHRHLMAVSVPVQDLGAFILTIDPERFLYPLVKKWPVPSATGETMLVRREGNTVVNLSGSRPPPEFASRSASTASGGHIQSGNRQVDWMSDQSEGHEGRVLGTVLPVPDSSWFVVAKIDASEVDAPVKRLAWEMGFIVALLASANIAAVALVWRSQQMRIYKERESLLREMADETPALLWTTAGDESTMFINRSLAEFVGGSQNQKPQGTWRTYLHPDDVDRVAENFYRCVATGTEFNEEHRLRRFDGEYRWVLARGLPRQSDETRFVHYSGSLLDITERKLAEMEIKDLTARLINAQEEERTRLARELHDDLGQQLAALNLAVGNLKREIPSELLDIRAQSERIREKLVHLANATRRLSHELHPAVLQHCGLEIALRAFCSEFSALAGIDVSFRSSGAFDCLSPAIALCAFRVAQEALQNVAKHAGSKQADISLMQSAGAIVLTVSDYGVGMDLNASRSGLGLTSIKERVRVVNGTVEIQSRANRGTSLTLTLPRAPDAARKDREDQDQPAVN